MNKLFIFVAGAITGSLVTYAIYKQQVVEKINADLECYHNTIINDYKPTDDVSKQNNESTELIVKSDEKNNSVDTFKTAYNKICNDNSYVKKGEDMKREPYAIEPDEYGDYIDYDQIELTYFADGILVDDMTDEILDIKSTVGEFFYDHFGENDDPDTIYIRNDELRKEYEIAKDDRNSSDVISTAYINNYE